VNYASLLSNVADFLNRQDLTAVIPTFIELAEANFNRTLRTRAMVKRATAEIDGQFTSLPDDWLEAINVQITTNRVWPLQALSPELADELRGGSSGVVKNYVIVGESIEMIPPPDSATQAAIEMTYYGRIPALSSTNQTNWLLQSSPDLYLHGALIQAAPYLRDDERLATWGSLYARSLADLQDAESRSMYSGSTLVSRVSRPYN
jgi:hypothetical protein